MKQEGALFDAEHIERVEAELDSFVGRRAREAKDAEKVAELWASTEHEHREKRRQANGWGWIEYHEGLAHVLRDLAQVHDAKAAHVRELLGLEALPGELPSKNGYHHSGGEQG